MWKYIATASFALLGVLAPAMVPSATQAAAASRPGQGIGGPPEPIIPPVLGPAPSLPAPNTCNVAPECCADAPIPNVDYYGNLLYGHDSDQSTDLYLDAYLPSNRAEPVPAIVYVHGGDFIAGSKCAITAEADQMVPQGVAVLSIDYPLASQARHPFADVPADTELAVQWVRKYAVDLGIVPGEIALWGTSAGAAIAYVAAENAAVNDPVAQVQAVAGWSGPYDMITEFAANHTAQPALMVGGEDYIGCSDFTDTTCFVNLVSASPIAHVTAADPPSLLVTSTDSGQGPGKCEVVNPQNTVEMDTALTMHGVPATVQTTQVCAHALAYAFDTIDGGTSTMLDRTTTWLFQQLTTPSAPRTAPTPLPPRLIVPVDGAGIVTAASICALPPHAGVTYQANLIYGQDFAHPTYLDAYLPQGEAGPVPGVILVHGGGHVSGDKCDVSQEAIDLGQQGFAVFALNYPLATAQQPTFPNPVYDVMDAVSWVRSQADSLGVDPNRIGLWGGSAGGNLALSAALAAHLAQPASAVQAIADWSGTSDTFELIGEYENSGISLGKSSWATYLGCHDPWSLTWSPSANACLVSFEQASPAQFIDGTTINGVGSPPTLVATSTDFLGNGHCEIVPPRQQEEVYLRSLMERVPTQIDTNSECAHAFAYLDTEFPSTLKFFEKYLGPTDPVPGRIIQTPGS